MSKLRSAHHGGIDVVATGVPIALRSDLCKGVGRKLWRTLVWPLYWGYEHRLEREVGGGPMPAHIGLILDGNRRFARGHGFESVMGHHFGVRKLRAFLEWCVEFSVRHVTLYVFSTENFKRAPDEVEYLLNLFVRESEKLLLSPRLRADRIRVKVIGQRYRLPPHVIEASEALEVSTAGHDGMLLTIALAYGGREEIADAVRDLLQEAVSKKISMEELASSLSADELSRHLYTAGMPDPDFIIRTSGEQRLSGFLLWQSAYSEFYFCDALWPEFRRIDFLRALRSYQRRERRYGR